MSFPRYPKYKDSGVEWLGEVPEGWEVTRLANLGDFSKGTGGTKADETDSGVPCVRYGLLYSAYSTKIETPVSFISETKRCDYTAVLSGDLLFAASGETLEEIGKSAVVLLDDCVCGGDVVIFRPEKRHGHSSEFLGYLCDSAGVQTQKSAKGRGLTVMHIYPTQLRDLHVPIPPPAEQTAIAAFLDRETAKIDGLVAEQRRLMELLKEKRQAVISHAVTKGLPAAEARQAGLNPAAPMKPSGIEWLGDVPEHWTIKLLKFDLDLVTSGSRGWAQYFSDDGELFFRITNIQRGHLEPDLSAPQYVTPPEGAEGERSRICIGDILISITADLGSVTVAPEILVGAYVSQHVCLARPGTNLCSRWAGYAMKADCSKVQFEASGYGGTKIQLSLGDIRNIQVALPPMPEQEIIAAYLDDECGKLDALITETLRAIDLLKERRTALISAAVTGQIDVREEVAV